MLLTETVLIQNWNKLWKRKNTWSLDSEILHF